MGEVTGTLADGNQYRLTASAIEITGPTGASLHHIQRADISMYARFGNSLRIVTTHGYSIELPAASDTDARQIEEHVRRIRSGIAPIVVGEQAEQSSSSPTSRFALLPVIGMVIGAFMLTAVGAGAWYAYGALLGHEDRATADYAPASSWAYVVMNTDPTSRAWLNAWNLARRVGIDDELASLPQQGLAESGEDAGMWDNLIRPAVGREVGFAVWPSESADVFAEPNVAAIVMIVDRDKAAAAMNELLEAENPEDVVYRDATYQVGGDNTAVGIVNDALVVASAPDAFEDVVDASLDGSLSGVESFIAAADRAADDPLVYAWINTEGVIAELDESGALDALAQPAITASLDSYRQMGAITVTVKAEADALRFVTLTEGRPDIWPSGVAGSAFAGNVPDSTVLFAAGSDLYETGWKPMMEQFTQLQDMAGAAGPGTAMMPSDLQTALGIKYAESLVMHLRGPFAVSLNAEESPVDLMGYAGGFHFFSEVDDPSAMLDALNVLADGIEAEGIPVMRTGSGFSVAAPEGVTAEVSVTDNVLKITGNYGSVSGGRTLANDPTYRLAMDGMPQNASATGYVAIDKIVDLVPDEAWADADPELRAALEALGPLAYASVADGDGTRTDAALFVTGP